MKKMMFILAVLLCGLASAAVDVNQADQAALDGVKGIGPTTSKAILAERSKHGEFRDWTDLQTRVKGIGDRNAAKFSEAGLTVNGAPKPASSQAKERKAAGH